MREKTVTSQLTCYNQFYACFDKIKFKLPIFIDIKFYLIYPTQFISKPNKHSLFQNQTNKNLKIIIYEAQQSNKE